MPPTIDPDRLRAAAHAILDDCATLRAEMDALSLGMAEMSNAVIAADTPIAREIALAYERAWQGCERAQLPLDELDDYVRRMAYQLEQLLKDLAT